MKSTDLDADFRPIVDVEREVHQLGAGRQILDLVSDLGELIALLRHHAADDAFDLRTRLGSMNVSRRMVTFSSFSLSSIFDVSMAFDPT